MLQCVSLSLWDHDNDLWFTFDDSFLSGGHRIDDYGDQSDMSPQSLLADFTSGFLGK